MTEPRLLGGRYELDAVVGRGGMAEVYAGRDLRLDRRVAVKALRADLATEPTFQARFRREAQSAASLNHPSIAAVYDTGEDVLDGSTVPYIVMEYVAGRTLRDMLRDDRQLLPERGLEIIDGVLRALEYSHSKGFIHRDIKPANIMITTEREVKVMDFGIARAVHEGTSTMTQTAQVVGTAQYLSPEQARGERVDTRSDVYSTGCVLYEILTGSPPFRGDSPVAIAYQHVREEPIPPSHINPDVPAWADPMVLKAMAKDAGARYQSAADMRADVQRALAGQPVTPAATAAMTAAQPHGGATSTQALPPVDYDENDTGPRRRRWPWVVVPLVLIFLAAMATGGWYLTQGLRDKAPEQVAVPRVVGKPENEARTMLTQRGLGVQVRQRHNGSKPPGVVYDQKPVAGHKVDKNKPVTIFVSQGAKKVTVPSGLVGKSQSEAESSLQEAGLHVGNVTTKNSPEKKGQVLSADPSGGSRVKKGSGVDLVVSGGVATKSVPSVVGQSKESGYAKLRDAGFQVNVKYQTMTAKPEGTIYDQSPDGGSKAEKGSPVTIFVAQKPQSTTPETTTPPGDGSTTTPPSSTTPPGSGGGDGGDGDGGDGDGDGGDGDGGDGDGGIFG